MKKHEERLADACLPPWRCNAQASTQAAVRLDLLAVSKKDSFLSVDDVGGLLNLAKLAPQKTQQLPPALQSHSVKRLNPIAFQHLGIQREQRMSKSGFKHLDPWSAAVIAFTLVLFAGALLYKGFTHDMLLEAGVFLVSLKLILMAYKNGVISESLHKRLDGIQESLRRLEDAYRPK